jgi:hypothetical protein
MDQKNLSACHFDEYLKNQAQCRYKARGMTQTHGQKIFSFEELLPGIYFHSHRETIECVVLTKDDSNIFISDP